MGECMSKSSTRSPLSKSHASTSYIIPLNQYEQHLHPQLLILPSDYQYFHNNLQPELQINFQTLKVFQSRAELLDYKLDIINNVLVIGCRTPDEAMITRRLPNFCTFSHIVVACDFKPNNVNEFRENCRREFGWRFGAVINYSSKEIVDFMEEVKEGRSVFFCHRDIGHINRTNLAFDFFFRQSVQLSFQNFFKWAERTEEGKTLVQRMQTMSQNDMGKFIVDNLFSGNKVLTQAINILKVTRNPGLMNHTAWLCSTLFKFIKTSYPKFKKRVKTDKIQEFAVWVALNRDEMEGLRNAKGENFMFSTFAVGYRDIDAAPPKMECALTLHKFIITLPSALDSYDPQVDLGFYYDQNRVIFNLQNMFRVDFIDNDQTISATYCSVGNEVQIRKGTFRYNRDASQGNKRMMKLYQCYDLSNPYINSELDLVLALQFYHTYKTIASAELKNIAQTHSIHLKSKDNLISTANSIEENQSTSSLLPKGLMEKLGDAEMETGNFQAAADYYDHMKLIERGFLKKLNLYMMCKDRVKFRETVQQVKKYREQKKEGYMQNFQGIAINNFIAIMHERSGQIVLADKINNECFSRLNVYYEDIYVDRKGNNKKGRKEKPLYRESYSQFPLYYVLLNTKCIIGEQRGHSDLPLTKQQCDLIKTYFDGIHIFWLPE